MLEFISEEIRDRMFRILRPHFWFQNYPTCNIYSRALEEKIQSGAKVKKESKYQVELDGVELWVGNYPYAYGTAAGERKLLPAARVRKMLKQYIEKQLPNEFNPNPWSDK